MRVNKSVEQAIYVVVMLELEAGGRPLKSSVMSRLLGVSDSYLKKILRKMVVTGIVESSASRGGGHSLCRPASEVTLADIVDAVDEMAFDPGTGHLAQNLFGDDPHVGQAERKVQDAFTRTSHRRPWRTSSIQTVTPPTASTGRHVSQGGPYEEGGGDKDPRGTG